jgi:uncharacterized membrane protein
MGMGNQLMLKPMDQRLRLVSLILAGFGLIDATYLTWVKYADRQVACIQGFGNCNTVNQSAYSMWNGVPIALIGALGYVAIMAIIFFEDKHSFLVENGRIFILGLSLIGFVYSIYLIYLEIAVIKAICPYCVGSATLMTLILILTIIRLVPISQK